MKMRFGWLALLLMVVTAGCAGSSAYMTKGTAPVQPPPADKAVVYFMRPSGMGFAIHFQIWDGNKLIGLSQAKSYFAYECDPGKRLFIGIAENKRGIEADLEAGKSYYVITQVKMGGWKARMAFIPVNRGSEFWDKVEAYKQELNYITPNKEEMAKWEAEKGVKLQNELKEIMDYLNTSEGRVYVSRLDKEDGR